MFKKIYHGLERLFERITTIVTSILGNSITFLIALGLVAYFLTNKKFYEQDLFDCLRDLFHGIIFLTLFIIQKAFNRFTAALNVKINELVVSHEPAKNHVIAAENKTEKELNEMSKEYLELVEEKGQNQISKEEPGKENKT